MQRAVYKTLWFLAIGILSVAISAKVNAACDSGDNNWGVEQNYICFVNSLDCNGDTCETDTCSESLCPGGEGNGYLTYCVGNQFCGMYNGCLGCQA